MSVHHFRPAALELAELETRVVHEFRSRYLRSPDCIVAAPGRVNLIGEHIDYNDGFVLPMAIERYVVIAGASRNSRATPSASFYSANLKEVAYIPIDVPLRPGPNGWVSYSAGVIAGFSERNLAIPAFDAVLESNVPLGGGLSSSAALEVATATLLEVLTNTALDPVEKALLCQQAEHRFAGVPCGIMDQFSSVFGEPNTLMLLDCRSQKIQPVPFETDEMTVLIINSNVKHELSGGEYAERRSQCGTALAKLNCESWRDVTVEHLTAAQDRLTAEESHRARHVVTEIARTQAAADAFRSGEWGAAGELMYASHESLRDDYEVSCRELDILVDLARGLGTTGGVIGSRMTGGGFGGCTVSLVSSDRVESVSNSLKSAYQAETGIKPQIFASRPARGAHVIRA